MDNHALDFAGNVALAVGSKINYVVAEGRIMKNLF